MKAPRTFADVGWDEPLTMADVADIIRWSHDRTSRVLHRVNDELHKLLLRNIGGTGRNARWTTTKRRLRLAFPEWFGNVRDRDEDIDELKEKVKELERRQNMSASAVGALRRDVDRLRVA